jgi:cytochrome o ubiquinol oxidase subunit 2
MLTVVLPVILLTFAFAWRYRASNTKAKYLPNWQHSTTLELIWWTIPCLIVAYLGAVTWISSHHLDPYRPLAVKNNKVLTIQAIALEWKWLFIYPEQNIATVNYLEIPTGVPVRFLITSEGPMNSLQIPQLGGQIYAMAGMQTQLHLIADFPGDYRGISANFSGDGFSDMKFMLHAGSQADFDHWVKTAKKAPEKLTLNAYMHLAERGVSKEIKYYSSARKELFETVVMKSMMPMPEIERLAQK